MKYSQIDIEAVEQAADIREIVPDLKGRGASLYCKCPQCGKEGKGKGLVVTHKKEKGRYVNVAKCFACGFSYGSAIKAYQAVNAVGYIEAVEALARITGSTSFPSRRSVAVWSLTPQPVSAAPSVRCSSSHPASRSRTSLSRFRSREPMISNSSHRSAKVAQIMQSCISMSRMTRCSSFTMTLTATR